MAYSVKADILARISQQRYDAITQGVDDNMTTAIADADSEIDSYLKSVIDDLPLAEPPAFIKRYSVVMAIKNASISQNFQDIPEWVRKEYDGAIKHLENISKGLANIKVADSVTRNDIVSFEDVTPIFKRDSW